MPRSINYSSLVTSTDNAPPYSPDEFAGFPIEALAGSARGRITILTPKPPPLNARFTPSRVLPYIGGVISLNHKREKAPSGRGPRENHIRKTSSPRWILGFVLATFLTPGLSNSARAASDSEQAVALLRSECSACHNTDKKKGGLLLTSREGLLAGGSEGAVVTPGKPDSSKLLATLAAEADPHMPPKGQLSSDQIQLLRRWIQAGVPWEIPKPSASIPSPAPLALGALPTTYTPVLATCISPDGRTLAAARGGNLALYSIRSNHVDAARVKAAHTDAIQSVAWSPDGRWIATGGWRKILLWDAEGLRLSREWTTGLENRITALEFGVDSKNLYAADGGFGAPGFIRSFAVDGSGSGPENSWQAHLDTIFDLELSRDGQQLASAGADKLIRLWDTKSHRELAVLEGHSAAVLSVAFNTNATQVASGGADRELKVWDVATREKIAALGQHTSAISALKWFSKEQILYAAREDGVVLRFSDIKSHSGEQSSASATERQLGSAVSAVMSLSVLPDHHQIFAGTQDGSIASWDDSGKALATLTNALPNLARKDVASLATAATDASLPNSPKAPRPPSAKALDPGSIVAISLLPPVVRLSGDSLRQTVLVTARTADGLEHDVTTQARFAIEPQSPIALGLYGELHGKRPGQGKLKAHFMGKTTEIPVEVLPAISGAAGATQSAGLSFIRDVLPVLSKAGCNAGACHAKPEGQNGFRLSVFSFDPQSDFHEIVQEARGRRIFPAAPNESLFLKKPLGQIPHEGGVRFSVGSPAHRLLVEWILEGMPYSVPHEPTLVRIEMFPKERRYKKGAIQRLVVIAHYSDQSSRDVSQLATFASNDREIVKIEEQPVLQVGSVTGQGVVVARYMGHVADSQVLIPADQWVEPTQYSALPRRNFIDELALSQFQELGLLPSDLCTDAEFLRRATLDAIGILPTPAEATAFAADTRPDKRDRLIERLLQHKSYADYWANKWTDLLRPNPDRVGVKSIFTLDQWVRASFRENKPYDQFVREILTAEGMNHREGPAVIYRDRREPADLTTLFSQLFLGTRLECARCHHHPNEKWGQEDFYQFAAYFGPLKQKGAGLSPPISAGMETFYHAPGGEVRHPVTKAVLLPKPPDGPFSKLSDATDPRLALADWLTAPENPFFAKAAVNRVWASFFGRGLVEPVDDFRISNPCVNPALLTALAEDFAKHGFDLKHLMRRIMESRLYQLSTVPNASNLADTRNFSRSYRRRLPAEVLLDAVSDVTGVPESFVAMPPGTRAIQTWSYKIDSQFMDAFGRPNPSTDCPCERDLRTSVVQTLHLMHSKGLQSKLSHARGRAHGLATSTRTPADIIAELYLLCYSRPPSPPEADAALRSFKREGVSRQEATEDVLWALLNSAEFIFNH